MKFKAMQKYWINSKGWLGLYQKGQRYSREMKGVGWKGSRGDRTTLVGGSSEQSWELERRKIEEQLPRVWDLEKGRLQRIQDGHKRYYFLASSQLIEESSSIALNLWLALANRNVTDVILCDFQGWSYRDLQWPLTHTRNNHSQNPATVPWGAQAPGVAKARRTEAFWLSSQRTASTTAGPANEASGVFRPKGASKWLPHQPAQLPPSWSHQPSYWC